MRRWMFAVVLLMTSQLPALAHVTPMVVLRKQADVIRTTLPGAVRFTATDVRPGKAQVEAILQRAHYTPNVATVRFYEGHDASGRTVGTVVFPQVDTQHGPIEVGVTIAPDGTIVSAHATRATVEMKPWILDVERSNALARLEGAREEDGPLHPGSELRGMSGFVADAIATAAYRALVLEQVLHTPAQHAQ